MDRYQLADHRRHRTNSPLHTNTEAALSFTIIKPRKKKAVDQENDEVVTEAPKPVPATTQPASYKRIDVASLSNVLIDTQLLEDALHHKASM